MKKEEIEVLNQTQADEIVSRYLSLKKRLSKVKQEQEEILQETKNLAVIYQTIQSGNRKRLGWWFKKWCPGIDLKVIKRWVSIASRTPSGSVSMQSWQMRLYGLVTTIHHSDKPLKKRARRVNREKSFVFYLGKGQELLAKKIEQMGGIDALTEDEKKTLTAQFGPMADTLKKLG